MKNLRSVVLVLSGLVIGCGAGATAVATSWAGPEVGKWQCYDLRTFPDVEMANKKHYAKTFQYGLRQAFPRATQGTVLSLSDGVVCGVN